MKTFNTIGLALTIGAATTAQAQWTNVGGNPLTTAVASYTSLARDTNNNYYVSYYAGSLPKGSVKKYNGTSWSYLGDSTVGVTPGTATYNSLAVNNAGEVFYSFQDGANGSKLSVKKWSPAASAWSDLGVAISGGIVNYQHLKVLPSSGYPVVSYKEAAGISVKRYNGTAWVDVASLFSTSVATHSMYVDANDTVYITIQSGNDYSVMERVLHFRTETASSNFAVLTLREKEILKLITEECTTQEIADKLFISFRTVENHRYNLLQKFGVKNSIGLVKIAIQYGLV